VGNCNGFFDPARAVLQRHETANSDEVRRIGPALVPLNSSWGCRQHPVALCCSARTGLFSHFLPTTCMRA
jgi:hypothetical protein